MKFFFQLNIVLQVFWIVAIVASIMAPFWILYIALFMGINHIIFSTVLLIGDGFKSKLQYHIICTGVYFLIWFLFYHDVFALSNIDLDLGYQWYWIIGGIPPAFLAIHYWYISFVHLNPFKKIEHNVFDL
ncbi:MAG: hypothetical protein ACI8SE_000304 [Bacteroidia bacterium]|jgi:hypothetical protein